ncbi:MAG: hypothetical protein DDT30_01155 [Dehalococcoidia bacterium]|nr:hypothetical protein [Bacillota bacterium]
MRECHSADIFCRAFYRQNEESFLEAQIYGFDFFQGISKRMIFDNAKVAVKEGFDTHNLHILAVPTPLGGVGTAKRQEVAHYFLSGWLTFFLTFALLYSLRKKPIQVLFPGCP